MSSFHIDAIFTQAKKTIKEIQIPEEHIPIRKPNVVLFPAVTRPVDALIVKKIDPIAIENNMDIEKIESETIHNHILPCNSPSFNQCSFKIKFSKINKLNRLKKFSQVAHQKNNETTIPAEELNSILDPFSMIMKKEIQAAVQNPLVL